MVKFQAEKLHQALRNIAIAESVWETGGKKDLKHTDAFLTGLLKSCDEIMEICDAVGMPLSNISAGNLKALWEEEKQTTDVVIYLMQELGNRLRDELETRLMYCITSEKAQYYDSAKPLWGEQVLNSFSSASYDIAEAGNTYALGRNTACVFHCMRVMEIGINSLAVALGIAQPIEHDRTWGKVLKKVSNQLEHLSKSTMPEWVARVPKIENAYAFMRAAKNAWRDDTMHIGPKYDEQDAKRIMNATENFMQDLATLIDEKGKFLIP